jgi:hypothetical protein
MKTAFDLYMFRHVMGKKIDEYAAGYWGRGR